MADTKRIVTMGGTGVCILAIGFFMQGGMSMFQGPAQGSINGASMASMGLGAPEPAPGVNGVLTPAELESAALTSADTELLAKPVVPQAEQQVVPQVDRAVAPARSAEKPVEISLLDEAPASPAATTAPRSEPKITEQCEIAMTGSEIAGALAKLSLDAPCMPNERVTLHHNGMMFTETTGPKGKLDLVVPALTQNAVFIASFANGEGAVANVDVTTLDLFDRAVVQSSFDASVGLHALEYGADYDQTGHVWANAAGNVADAALGQGGFMTLLGNPAVKTGKMAQVYTFPSAMAEQSGDVTLSVEIEVTSANCGLEIEAQSLQVNAGGQPKVQTLDLTMPDCDAVGDFLVLKKLVNDLKVAANN